MSSNAAKPVQKRSNVVRVLHWGDQPAKIVVLIGSSKFQTEFNTAARKFTREGNVVLAPHLYTPAEGAMTKQEQDVSHELTLKRIDMADLVVVINPNNRMTETTHKEVDYAESLNREVIYLETPASR